MAHAVEEAHHSRPLEAYAAALDAGVSQKLDVVEPWVRSSPAGDIIDIGAGTGALSVRLAHLHPRSSMIGVDAAAPMVRLARRRYGRLPNLTFRTGDARDVHSESASCVVLCSVLHEVYSYHGDSLTAVEDALRSAWQSLLPGGRMIIRDFVIPPAGRRPALLCHRRSDIISGHDFVSFCYGFPRPLCLRAVRAMPRAMVYETDVQSACEYVLRKDYHQMWDAELQERYGFWTIAEAHHLIRSVGFSIVHSELLSNSWVLLASLRDTVVLKNSVTLHPLQFPPSQLFVVAEKPRYPD